MEERQADRLKQLIREFSDVVETVWAAPVQKSLGGQPFVLWEASDIGEVILDVFFGGREQATEEQWLQSVLTGLLIMQKLARDYGFSHEFLGPAEREATDEP